MDFLTAVEANKLFKGQIPPQRPGASGALMCFKIRESLVKKRPAHISTDGMDILWNAIINNISHHHHGCLVAAMTQNL